MHTRTHEHTHARMHAPARTHSHAHTHHHHHHHPKNEKQTTPHPKTKQSEFCQLKPNNRSRQELTVGAVIEDGTVARIRVETVTGTLERNCTGAEVHVAVGVDPE